ncbi:MAG: isoleucine--tRNA ligase [bacterium]|nr:isoleucine--tRNA ligase [Candidatus Sumerlaeota bacterium]
MTTEPDKTDYKNTLCLPQTAFPMKANLYQRETEILRRWHEISLDQLIARKPSGNGTYILHDGPPYANGHIHVGHALNKILKDIVVRHRTMLDYHSPYVPGWDCHGLPIEQKVTSELGPKKASMTPLEIRRLCEQYARKWMKVQSEEFQRLGVGGMWDKPYLTIDPRVEASIVRALGELTARGYIYKGLKPVYWCVNCQTALAEAEIEYENCVSPSIYVKFPVCEPESRAATAGLLNPGIVIWTTTPWTLPANLAVSLHPDFKYVAIRVKTPRSSGDFQSDAKGDAEDWIVAKDLVDAFVKDADLGDTEIVREISARDLEHMQLEHPVQPGRTSVVVLGTHVTLDQGTGAVHTAPGHGIEDFIVCQEYGLPTIVPVDAAGRFTSEFQLMEGMLVWEANGPIVRYLDEKDILIRHKPYEHSYPHCWRCHKPIIYRATEQWFMNVDHDDLRKKSLAEIDASIKWIPKWGHDRIYNMIAQRPDWCLSRQRVWGVPIPAVDCKACGKAVLSPDVIAKFAAVVESRGTNAWFEDEVEAFLPDEFKCPDCGAREFDKEHNILDVWFDSGSTHVGVLESRPELRSPADMYLEGSDQHRGWFHSSLLISMAIRGKPPYREVLTHGFVLDGKGEAMSKSKGNVIAPQDVIKKYGADVLRLWVASQDHGDDDKVSNEILERVGEAYRRIRNTIRYLLGNLCDFNPATDTVPYEELTEIDRWALHQLHELVVNVARAYDEYEYHKIVSLTHPFCVVRLSAVYLDVLKDRVYCSGAKSHPRRAAQTAQYEIAQALLRMLAPILVFTCDEAYQLLDAETPSVHLRSYPQPPDRWRQPALAAEWERLLAVRADVLGALEDARKEKKAIGQSLEARVVIATADKTLMSLLTPRRDDLADLFITSQAELAAEPPAEDGAITRLQGERAHVTVYHATGSKCARCWKFSPSVGGGLSHPALCDRCADVIRRHY